MDQREFILEAVMMASEKNRVIRISKGFINRAKWWESPSDIKVDLWKSDMKRLREVSDLKYNLWKTRNKEREKGLEVYTVRRTKQRKQSDQKIK